MSAAFSTALRFAPVMALYCRQCLIEAGDLAGGAAGVQGEPKAIAHGGLFS